MKIAAKAVSTLLEKELLVACMADLQTDSLSKTDYFSKRTPSSTQVDSIEHRLQIDLLTGRQLSEFGMVIRNRLIRMNFNLLVSMLKPVHAMAPVIILKNDYIDFIINIITI